MLEPYQIIIFYSCSSGFAGRANGGKRHEGKKNPNHDRTTITREQLKKREKDHLGVDDIPGKGCGVLAARPFSKNEMICQYTSEHITVEE